MNADTIRQPDRTGLPGARAQVQGDDGVHFEATVVCRGVPRQAAAGPPPHGLRHAGRAHGRRDPRAGAAHADARTRQAPDMQKIVVDGGEPLHGEVQISGAKNAVLPILCATLLADGPVAISNVPHLHDVVTTAKLLARAGRGAHHRPGHDRQGQRERHHRRSAQRATATSRPTNWSRPCAPRSWCSARCSRGTAQAEVSLPGGCAIGSRPVDLHIKGLQALGAEITRRERLHQGAAPKRPAAAARVRVRHGQRRRHRERADGRGARRGHHRARERGDGAGDRRPRRLPERDGREDRRRRHRAHRRRGRRTPAWRHATTWCPTASRPARSWSPAR